MPAATSAQDQLLDDFTRSMYPCDDYPSGEEYDDFIRSICRGKTLCRSPDVGAWQSSRRAREGF